MDLIKALQDLIASVSVLQLQLADAQAGLDIAVKQGYDKGFSDGVVSVGGVVPVSDKIYSQVEMDSAVALLNAQIIDLQSQVDSIKASLQPSIDAAILQVKSDLLVKYQEYEVAEKALETGFESLLK